MRINEITQPQDTPLIDAAPTAAYCRNTPADKMSASWLASCKSQGYKSRSGKKSHLVNKKRITVGGRKIKGRAHGGPLPDYSGS
jgi:hypothetical protein